MGGGVPAVRVFRPNGLSKWEFFIALAFLYIVLGCFIDGISMIYMTLPVLLPVVKGFGFDLIWFGVILTVLSSLARSRHRSA